MYISMCIDKKSPSSKSTARDLGVLELPNGTKLHIHSVELLSVISHLWSGQI